MPSCLFTACASKLVRCGTLTAQLVPLSARFSVLLQTTRIVVGVAVLTLGIFLVINLVTSQRVTSTTTPVAIVGGLALDPANLSLRACSQAGSPPGNIVPALVVPVHTLPAGAAIHANGGAGDYDCLRQLTSTASAGQILGFYRARLESQGWSLFSSGSSHAIAQLLFQKAGSDTFYWVVGVTIDSRTSSATSWTFRIYQNSSMI